MFRRLARTLMCTAATLFLPTALTAEELPSDPRNLTRRLDNGVTWICREHAAPPAKLALLLHVRAGSLNETDAQRGLANFLQSLAFKGSENFSPDSLTAYFDSIGMKFGDDVNAFTSFDQTIYTLFLSDTTAATIEKALILLSDQAFRLSLTPEAIEQERALILEKRRAGGGPEQRLRDKLFTRLFAGSRFAERLPGGVEEVLKTAGRQQLLDYYRAWYRPDNTTLITVGDVRCDDLRPLVEKWFGQARTDAAPPPYHGPGLQPFTRERAIVVTDAEYDQGDVNLITLRPARPPTTTIDHARRDLIEQLALWLVDRRLTTLIEKGAARFHGASLSINNFFNDGVLVHAAAVGKPADWAANLTELLLAVRRARQYGFSQRELDRAGKEFLANAEQAARLETTRHAQELLTELAARRHAGEPALSAAQNVEMLKRLLPTITLADVNQAFADRFAPGALAYVLQMPDRPDVPVPTEDEVLATARAALEAPLEPRQEPEPTELLAAEPRPGKLVESTLDPDLQITSGWLDNGARIHHRYMDHRKDAVFVTITLAGGRIEETADTAGVTETAALAFQQPATDRLTSTQISDLMSGKNIRVEIDVAEDAFTVVISGSPRDLEIGLQLAHALLTDGRVEGPTFERWKQFALQQLATAERMADFQAGQAVAQLLSDDDPRRTPWTTARVERRTQAAAQEWLERLCREAPLEVAIVGDVSLETAVPLLERYVGSLPARPRGAARLEPLRKIRRKAGPLESRVAVDTTTPRAMLYYGFCAADYADTDDARVLYLAAHVLSSRLTQRLREELRLAQVIQTQNVPGRAYRDSGLFLTAAICDAAQTDDALREIAALFNQFADDGLTAAELDNARRQWLDDLDQRMREPAYWIAVLRTLDLHQLKLARVKSAKDDLRNYSADQVRDAFRKYYTPDRTFRVVAKPAAPTTAPTAPATVPAVPATTAPTPDTTAPATGGDRKP